SHTGVRVRERLTRTIDVEVPESRGRDVIGPADVQHELLLVPLGGRVNRGGMKRLQLVGGNRDERLAGLLIENLPLTLLQLRDRSRRRRAPPARRRALPALT